MVCMAYARLGTLHTATPSLKKSGANPLGLDIVTELTFPGLKPGMERRYPDRMMSQLCQ